MKTFCVSLREHAANVINLQNKNILPLTEYISMVCYLCRKNLTQKVAKDKEYRHFRHYYHF